MKRLLGVLVTMMLLGGCGSGVGNARTTCLGLGFTNQQIDDTFFVTRLDRDTGISEARKIDLVTNACRSDNACISCSIAIVREVY